MCGDHQRQLLEHRKGEVDLMLVRGKWYLAAVCDIDDPSLLTPEGMLGVDLVLSISRPIAWERGTAGLKLKPIGNAPPSAEQNCSALAPARLNTAFAK